MPQIDIDGANSKISADTIRGQSGTTVTVPTGHTVAITDVDKLTIAGTAVKAGALGYTEVGVATTTSGSTSTISGIPAEVKTVMIVVNATSNTGVAELQLLLGDSGGIETSGYLSMSHKSDVGTVTHSSDTTYILLANGGGGADPYSGIGHLTRSASGVNTWVYTSIIYQSIQAQNWTSATKSLSGELTQIQLKTSGTFDAGNWNIYYQ